MQPHLAEGLTFISSHSTYFGDVGGSCGTGSFRCDRLCTHKHARLQISTRINLSKQRNRNHTQIFTLPLQMFAVSLGHYNDLVISYNHCAIQSAPGSYRYEERLNKTRPELTVITETETLEMLAVAG